MKKVAHLVIDYGLISETFIESSVDILRSVEKVDYTLIYQTSHKSVPGDISSIQCDFAVLTNAFHKFINKVSFSDQELKLLIKNSRDKLLKVFSLLKPDILFIDFGITSVLAYQVCNELKIPFIIHLHGSDITTRLSDGVYKDHLKKVFKSCNKVITASFHIRRLAILNHCAEEKIEVVRYPLKPENIRPTKDRTKFPSLIFLGRLTEKKHPVALLPMLKIVQKSIKDVRLTIIGDGELKGELIKNIKRLKLDDQVKVIGAVPNEKALEMMKSHWIYVQHSVTARNGDQEGFGISLAEAALLELPIVSTIHNGIPEQVVHGETGYLCQEYDFEKMADYVIELIQNENERLRMGRNGRKNIIKLCDAANRKRSLELLLT